MALILEDAQQQNNEEALPSTGASVPPPRFGYYKVNSLEFLEEEDGFIEINSSFRGYDSETVRRVDMDDYQKGNLLFFSFRLSKSEVSSKSIGEVFSIAYTGLQGYLEDQLLLHFNEGDFLFRKDI